MIMRLLVRASIVSPIGWRPALVATIGITSAAQTESVAFPIGIPGQPWGATEREVWLSRMRIQRDYNEEVVAKLNLLRERFDVQQYGSLTHNPERYPLYAVKSREWAPGKPGVLITGGVHGYEKSGVQGAILFLQSHAEEYTATYNLLVVPCISPWGYETIQRWNAQAVDPNRSFNPNGEVVPGRSFNPEAATEESSALLRLLASLEVKEWACHVDLHETTDTDESEFRPAKAARDGVKYTPGTIPDGFYLVADMTNPQTEWHKAIIDGVRKVTHIAPPDASGKIIDEPVVQEGVIAVPSPRSIGLCSGVTTAAFATTTEVYPDSPKADEDQCNRAQVAAIVAALDYISNMERDHSARRGHEPSEL
mmetsp:Transcript_62310/g.103623  ORF Transcript_62310/g.103623 Transcript_62310/m.103623 type:complete len:366 (-) Transcript_62310:191-1288(-)